MQSTIALITSQKEFDKYIIIKIDLNNLDQ